MLVTFLLIATLGLLAFLLLFFVYVKKKNIDVWLLSYLGKVFKNPTPKNKTIDIMFLCVDHFELNGNPDRLDAWQNRYPQIAGKHKDSDGCHPKHTFFYAMDLMHEHELKALQPLVENGFGEFELHWHHDHDTPETFAQKLNDAMDIFHRYDMMKPYQADTKACFGFIHGDWSLANSRGEEYCGVDNEVEILKSFGCFGDFTFPALFNQAQPPRVNDIYYCKNLDQPCCHFSGREAVVGHGEEENEFMIFQGPLTINWFDWRHKWHPTIEDGDINQFPTHNDPKRIKSWIRQGIHVKGKPEWVFVKTFCHGAQDHLSVVSEATDEMFTYLERHYNDGEKYRLHYVTAREAYNIVKAAEDGKSGNPNEFRDYQIPHPLNR